MAPRRRVKAGSGEHPDLVGVDGSGLGDEEDPGAERVLLVDDRPDNLMALVAVLEPLGFELLTAGSGHDALRTLLDTDVSAIVLDVQMPDMDGFETATLLKAREATRSVPVLFLTAVGLSIEHELQGYEVGGADYICKPFEPRVLQAKVRAAVRWGAELRALRKASRVYQEAAEALATVQQRPVPAGRPAHAASAGVLSPDVRTREIDRRFEPSVTTPAAARAAIRAALAGKLDALVDDAALLASELMANAVVHAGTDIRLRVDVSDRTVRVEVDDSGTRMPDPVAAHLTSETGRGWLLVGRIADRCGWTRLDRGKSVWFELRLDSGARPATASEG